MRHWKLCVTVLAATCGYTLWSPSAHAQASSGARTSRDAPVQTREAVRRPPVRIDIYRDGTRAVRECAPVFEERWIPQWGGRVLYAGQSCRWVSAR